MEKELESVKVAFVQQINKDQYETETMWCDIDGDNFIIDNIPIIAKNISLGDIIKAEYDKDDERYYFESLVLASGNSTIRIFMYKDEELESAKKWLNEKGCESEILLQRNIIAVNIPKNIDYSPIKKYLEDGEGKGIWTYEESCLEHDY